MLNKACSSSFVDNFSHVFFYGVELFIEYHTISLHSINFNAIWISVVKDFDIHDKFYFRAIHVCKHDFVLVWGYLEFNTSWLTKFFKSWQNIVSFIIGKKFSVFLNNPIILFLFSSSLLSFFTQEFGSLCFIIYSFVCLFLVTCVLLLLLLFLFGSFIIDFCLSGRKFLLSLL